MLQSDAICVGGMGETIDYLFVFCDAARLLWNEILATQHMDWVMSRRIEDVLKVWGRKLCDMDRKIIWNLVPGCIVWCV